MKTYDYQGSVIKEGNKTASIAYVQCVAVWQAECRVILININVPDVSGRTHLGQLNKLLKV